MAQTKAGDRRAGNLKNSYDAARSTKRRKVNVTNLRSEDRVLCPRDRDKVISDTRNLSRNASIVPWAIRKHLDYVSTFEFQCKTGNAELDDRIEGLIRWWARPLNCDVSGRYSLQALIRQVERLATVDGDVFLMKISDGSLQIIEGDRVRTPGNLGDFQGTINPLDYTHGIKTTASGKAIEYAVCDRDPQTGGFVLSSLIPAQYVYHHGYFDRYDQIRGISPLASAITTFCDLYEASEYALAKMKLAQLFALKLKLAGEADEDTEQDYNLADGPKSLNLGLDEDAELLESKSPSTEFQAFLQQGISLGLKSLDIPYSFFDEAHTNYSGARQALLMYEQSADTKRQKIKQLLTNLTLWRLGLFILDGELVLPDGMAMDDLAFEWVPAALPWIDPQKEATANQILLGLNLTSRQIIAKEQGKDWFDIADQLAVEDAYLRQKGLSTAVNPTPAQQQQQEPPQNDGEQNGNQQPT